MGLSNPLSTEPLRMLIITVTLSPAIDRVYHCRNLAARSTRRALACDTFAAGKGINVARGLKDMGAHPLCLGLAGGHTGAWLRHLLETEGLEHHLTAGPREVRINPTLLDSAAGFDLHVREPEAPVDAEEAAAFYDDYASLLGEAEHVAAVVVSGAAPPGLDPAFLRRLLDRARDRGIPSLLDTHGPLQAGGLAGRPWMVKNNLEEARDSWGGPHLDEKAFPARAAALLEDGVRAVVVSMGPEGALYADAAGAWRARPPAVVSANTVGCGDAMAAGLLIAALRGAAPDEVLRLGVAAGTASTAGVEPGAVAPEALARLLPCVEVAFLGPLPEPWRPLVGAWRPEEQSSEEGLSPS